MVMNGVTFEQASLLEVFGFGLVEDKDPKYAQDGLI